MAHTVLSWIFTILVFFLCFSFVRSRTYGVLARAFCGSGLLLLGLGLLGNTLVITANGGQMPVEAIRDWDDAPSFLSGPAAKGVLGRVIGGALDLESKLQPEDIHAYVGKSPGSLGRPNLAWLDDRFPAVICGDRITYSLGDALLTLGLAVTVSYFMAFLLVATVRLCVGKRRPKT